METINSMLEWVFFILNQLRDTLLKMFDLFLRDMLSMSVHFMECQFEKDPLATFIIIICISHMILVLCDTFEIVFDVILTVWLACLVYAVLIYVKKETISHIIG
jgi:hypothetical protein